MLLEKIKEFVKKHRKTEWKTDKLMSAHKMLTSKYGLTLEQEEELELILSQESLSMRECLQQIIEALSPLDQVSIMLNEQNEKLSQWATYPNEQIRREFSIVTKMVELLHKELSNFRNEFDDYRDKVAGYPGDE